MSWAEVKKAVNSAVGTQGLLPLDRLLGAIVVCKGVPGTRFDFVPKGDIGSNATVILSKDTPADASGIKTVYMPLLPGITYAVTITTPFSVVTTSVAPALGTHKVITYTSASNIELARILTDSTYTVPSDVYSIVVSGAGGGGGGGGTTSGRNSTSYYASGGGGGGGYNVSIKQYGFSTTPGEVLTIKIGRGGAGGVGSKDSDIKGGTGSTGGATVISNKVTIPGGGGGGGGGSPSTESVFATAYGGTTGGSNNVSSTGGAGAVSEFKGPGNGGKGGNGAYRYEVGVKGEDGNNGIIILYEGVVIK